MIEKEQRTETAAQRQGRAAVGDGSQVPEWLGAKKTSFRSRNRSWCAWEKIYEPDCVRRSTVTVGVRPETVGVRPETPLDSQ